jgi:hypothetical protein
MSERFSKGPWSTGGIFYYKDGPDRQNVWGPTDHEAGHSSGELICEQATVANAALIADAPEMYRLLQRIAKDEQFAKHPWVTVGLDTADEVRRLLARHE